MERLTTKYMEYSVPKDACTINRLGEADDCMSCKEVCEECNETCDICCIQKCLNKLADYEDAEEQGVLKIIPVAIGSDVYFIPSKVNYDLNVLGKHKEYNRVYHQKVAKVVFNERGWYLECDKDLEHGIGYILVDVFYKETWFTSEEEAERALKQIGE